jgi:hypothetical protein
MKNSRSALILSFMFFQSLSDLPFWVALVPFLTGCVWLAIAVMEVIQEDKQ